jgi:hypothetical protein
LALAYKIALDVAKKELGVVKTLSLALSKMSDAKCNAAVPLDKETQYFAPQYEASASSNA